MELTLADLRVGIQRFRARWPLERDFHAAFYARLTTTLESGLTRDAWWMLSRDLHAWKACRPLSQATIFANGLPGLVEIDALRKQLIDAVQPARPSLSNVEWDAAEPLFERVRSIKPTKGGSPMFASKLCHFLLPDLFPVTDGDFAYTSRCDYSVYWADVRAAWIRCGQTATLIAELEPHVPASYRAHYPWATKIADLCAAGQLLT